MLQIKFCFVIMLFSAILPHGLFLLFSQEQKSTTVKKKANNIFLAAFSETIWRKTNGEFTELMPEIAIAKGSRNRC